MQGPSDTFVLCHKCSTKNASDYTHCSQCKVDLLPGRTTGERIGFVSVGLLGIALIPILWWWLDNIYLGGGLLSLLIIMIFGGFTLAFTRTPLAERLQRRAERHLTSCPSQAVL